MVKDLEFLKPCKLNAHTAGCYCIAMDPLDRYFLFSIEGSLFILAPWYFFGSLGFVICTTSIGLSGLLFDLICM